MPPRIVTVLLSRTRVVVASVAFSAVIAVAGIALGLLRFGASDAALAGRLERDVRRTVEAQSASVETLARRMAAEPDLVARAAASREELGALFGHLQLLSATTDEGAVALTVYVPTGVSREYRVLAWSDGPGEQDLSADRLSGPSALFVAPGHVGLRLVAVEPIELDGRAIAVAVAERVLAPVDRTSARAERRLDTAYGPVTVIAQYASTRHVTSPRGFAVASASGAPLIEVAFDPDALAARRTAFQRRVLALALLPLALALPLLFMAGRGPRGGITSSGGRWRRMLADGAVAMITAAAIAATAQLARLPYGVGRIILLVGLLVVVINAAATMWWWAGRRRAPPAGTSGFAVAQLTGGLLLSAGLEAIARLVERWMTIDVLDRGPFVLFPFSLEHTLSIGGLLLTEAVIAWLVAAPLAALAIRWRVTTDLRRAMAAAALWLLPSVFLLVVPGSLAGAAGWPPILAAVVAVGFALAAVSLSRRYRRSTQSLRLMIALVAGLAPLFTLYPVAAVTADRATRRVIEFEYAPATAGHPQQLRAELTRAQQRVDEMAALPDLVSAMPSTDSLAAYVVWSQTGLEESRVISDVELYGRDRQLVSRFAFNLPEYVYRTTLQPWQGSECSWEVFGEAIPFGAENRRMLHAERGVCDAEGQLIGGVVLHVASDDDYQALPFISSPSPYYEMLDVGDAAPRLPNLALAVYGWSWQPLFTSGPATWSVAPDTFDRLYRTGESFWTTLDADGSTYDVHFSQNRSGLYALGVPRLTLVEHATRLAEIAALAFAFFVLWQTGLLVFARLARQPDAPLRQVFHEVRTSFYRKLFLSFVIVAVVPVLAAAVAFGGYMTARFRADVEHESTTTVTIARRVFEELTAGERAVQLQASASDDVMVWIRQVINHDVNLFDGPELLATSQRDLFDSGFLPTRTPASVYRAIALERRPVTLADDRVGTFNYLVVGAPVALSGRNAVLTVPLAPRQREMARDLDTFNRRVLVGAVLVVLFAAGVGASLAGRISDPVAHLSRATRQIASGRLDVRVATDTADELGRLVGDFNSMAATLGAQRAELARANQLKAWNEMARQVAHEIKNPLTPAQLAAEHLRQVHEDRGRPLGAVLDRCIDTVLTQVRLLRQIASDFANFAGEPTRRPSAIDAAPFIREIVEPYRVGLGARVTFEIDVDPDLPPILADRTLASRALTNLVENAVQAMPAGGTLTITARPAGPGRIVLTLVDTGVGFDALALEHAFEPYFSTKTAGSGLGLANARRNIEREGGTVTIESEPGRGATVTVTLPAAAPAPSAASGNDPAPSR